MKKRSLSKKLLRRASFAILCCLAVVIGGGGVRNGRWVSALFEMKNIRRKIKYLLMLLTCGSVAFADCEHISNERVWHYFGPPGLSGVPGEIRFLEVSGGELPSLSLGLESVLVLAIRSPDIQIKPEHQDYFVGFNELHELILQSAVVESFPILETVLAKSTELCSLVLIGTGLEQVEVSGDQLRRLEKLTIAGNPVRDLHPSIAKLTCLQELRIVGSLLQDLPKEMMRMRDLRRLYIIGSRFSSESVILLPDQLRELSFYRNDFTRIPEAIRTISGLLELDLSSNPVSEIPEWIVELRELEGFFLRSTEISEVPLFLLELPNIKQIDLMGSRVRQVPPEFEKWIEEGKLLIGD